MTDKTIRLANNFIFDYTTMMGMERISQEDMAFYDKKIVRAAQAVNDLRRTGYAKGHLSKDGRPEPVYFTRLPYIKDGYPNDEDSMAALHKLAEHAQAKVDVVVFLGVGGSYLGNKVLFDIFCGEGWNNLSRQERSNYPYVFFAGNNMDPRQCRQFMKQVRNIAMHADLKGERCTVLLVPISKSGTTMETLTAFSYFYSECSAAPALNTEVAVVTDLNPGAASPLYILAKERNWPAFDVKEGIGGRFSVLHNPGLVTAAAIGINIEELLRGARVMEESCQSEDYSKNPALLNASLKYIAAEKYGCDTEVFMGYGMCLKSLGEWYVQLLAESLGKRYNREGKTVFYGRTPIAAVGSTDMHAQTQQHQDGKRNKVIQFLHVDDLVYDVQLQNPFPHIDAFAKYFGLSLKKALDVSLKANREALDSDHRFSAVYSLPVLNEFYIGQLLYFLMLSIAYEGELADVDAYDQPGVEAYKKIMKRELAK